MASSSSAAPPPAPPSSLDWHSASRLAQDRIIALQSQRRAEAISPSRSRIARLLDSTPRPSIRVGQLDTELLDEELLSLLKGQLWEGLKYFRPALKDTFEPELLLLLRAALFKLTIWDHNATYGAALQNLRYTDARKSGPTDSPPTKAQKGIYGLVTVGGRYLLTRLNLFIIDNVHEPTRLSSKLSRFLDSATTLHSALSLVSFMAFLVTGRYRTILDRVLRMRLQPPNRVVNREVSFEYLNRQLVWHAFTEFLLFILPLLRIGRWRRWLSRVKRSMTSTGAETKGELDFLPERTCAICYKEESADVGIGKGNTDITNPYEAVECGHVYCYVCLAGKIELEEGEGWTCLRCGKTVKRCRPWRGGLAGLTEVGDWGEEVVSPEGSVRGRSLSEKGGDEEGSGEEGISDEDDDDGTERASVHSGDSDGTEKPGKAWSEADYEEGAFDDSLYNTAVEDEEFE